MVATGYAVFHFALISHNTWLKWMLACKEQIISPMTYWTKWKCSHVHFWQCGTFPTS